MPMPNHTGSLPCSRAVARFLVARERGGAYVYDACGAAMTADVDTAVSGYAAADPALPT